MLHRVAWIAMSESARRRGNNAWNNLDRYVDLGAPGSDAKVVTQPPMGLRPVGRGGSGSLRRYHSCAHRANLEAVPVYSSEHEGDDCWSGPGFFSSQAVTDELEVSDG